MVRQKKVDVDLGAKLTTDAAKRRTQLVSEYEENVTAVAVAMVNHQQGTHVDVQHINDAHGALARAGLVKPTFLERPETWSNFGALSSMLIGVPYLVSACRWPTGPWSDKFIIFLIFWIAGCIVSTFALCGFSIFFRNYRQV